MATSKKAAAIVVPNWNGAAFLAECLRSLEHQSTKSKLIVVDNGSTDDSVQIIQSQFPDVQLISLGRNYGFAGGVNRGIEAALDQDFDYVALFNNDAVADRHWLENLLVAAGEHPEAGIVTGKLLNQAGELIDSTGDFYSIWGFAFPRGRDEKDRGQYDKGGWVFGASGGASLYRAQMIRQIGLFDESFFAYYEDIDLSWRAQLAGWRIYYEPSAEARHRIGATSSQITGFARYHSIKNFYYLFLKNMPGTLLWKYSPRFTVSAFLMVINSVRRGQFSPLAKGYMQVLLKLPSMVIKRRRIQKSRKASSEYIDSILFHQIPPTQKNLLRLKQLMRRRT